MRELSLREIQICSLNVLERIHHICEKHGFSYYLIYGTLIGAIRHNGFIPWDDDIDITMPRSDYDKLIDLFLSNDNNIDGLELMHYKTNQRYIYPIARISDNRYKVDYKDVLDYGLGIFVDIYPLDGWGNDDDEEAQKIEKSFEFNKKCIVLAGCKRFIPSNINHLRTIPKYILYKYAKLRGVTYFLKIADNKAKKYDYNTCKFVGSICWVDVPNLSMRFFREDFEPMKHIFEGKTFIIPRGYDRILRTTYGDYMILPSEEMRNPHHNYRVYDSEL